jgi:hypothetical protein
VFLSAVYILCNVTFFSSMNNFITKSLKIFLRFV